MSFFDTIKAEKEKQKAENESENIIDEEVVEEKKQPVSKLDSLVDEIKEEIENVQPKQRCSDCKRYFKAVGSPASHHYKACKYVKTNRFILSETSRGLDGFASIRKNMVPDCFPSCNGFLPKDAE